MKRAARSSTLAGLTALLLALSLDACGEGRDVNLGAVVAPAAAGSGDGPECSEAMCEPTQTRLFVEPGAEDLSSAAFDDASEHPAASDPSQAPTLIYPADETMLPPNLLGLRFVWLPGAAAGFALDFVGPSTTVRVLTHETSLVPTDEAWAAIAVANRGGRVDLVVRGLVTQTGEVWRSSARALYVGSTPLDDDIYYWSTGARGLMRARLDAPRARRVFTDPESSDDAATCTGCHTISRDGKRLVAGYDKNELGEHALADGAVLVAPGGLGTDVNGGKSPPLVWSTFSPDGKLLLAAGGGKLRLLDADTGVPIGAEQGAVPLPMGVQATHPDWSPLGDRVVVTWGTKGGDKQTEGGSLATLPFVDGAFGEAEILVQSTGDKDNNFFPSFSPDARFVAYVNANGGSQDAASARLRLVEVATRAVHELTRLNERVGALDGVLDVGNSMPTWGPALPDGPLWLAFSSLREYADLRTRDVKQDQLWIAAVDPTLDDPGYAAFWAPFQSLGQGNHRAQWVVPGADDPRPSACTPPECDGLTTCDACAPREVCDDGLDDDCDCVIDDCSQEICGDMIDNDGDGKDDKMDPVCKAE